MEESNIARKESGLASEIKETDSDKGLVKLTKAERRQKLKKSKKEAKRKAKEEVKETVVEGGLHSDVLVLIHHITITFFMIYFILKNL